MSLITETACFLLIVYLVRALVNWLRHKQRALQTFRKLSIPGPAPSFFTGNFRQYLRWPHTTLDQWTRQFGSYFGYYQGELPVLVLSDIDDVQEVLVKLGKQLPNRQRPFINVEPFKSSLLNERGETWKHSRRVLTPPFTAHKIAMDTSKDAINASVKRLLESIEKKCHENSLDIGRHMKSVTLDVISRLAFNMEDTDVHEDNSELREMTTQFMDDSSNVVIELAAYLPFLKTIAAFYYNNFSSGRLVTTILEHLHKCILTYYEQKIKSKFLPETNEKQKSKSAKVNLLDFMLEQQEQGNLNEWQIMGNAIIVLLAGYETTATALTFTLYLLAKHPEIQQQLRQELQKTADQDKSQSNYCQFDENRCELLDRVWNESLRLYPPVVAFVTRELDDKLDQLTLQKSAITITKDMTVQIPVWTIHHDSQHWEEPLKFDPYRHNLPFPGSNVKNNAFIAFGAGPRNCIGGNLALSEARAVIGAIVSHYQVELISDSKSIDPETGLLKLVCPTVVIHPEKEIRLRLTPLNQS